MSCVHIYCGDGKGKTTAAIGLAVRAAGRNKKVLIGRFLKNNDSGEVLSLGRLPGISVMPCEKSFGFYFQMTEAEKKEAALYYAQLFDRLCRESVEKKYDMIVFDEIMAACGHNFVREEKILSFLHERPQTLEVVMTGRNPSAKLLESADYVSEIVKRKHPFDQGLGARVGIEY